MGKYLLLIAGVIVVVWLVRQSIRRRKQGELQGKTRSEDMVRCAECGVHLPRGESLVLRDRYFCCAEHQRRHEGGD